jgi:hypothetical protein
MRCLPALVLPFTPTRQRHKISIERPLGLTSFPRERIAMAVLLATLPAAHLGLEAQNHAAEIKLRAERRMGEMLGASGIQPGRPEKNQTPPDLVVKFQRIDIVDVILRLILRPRVVYQREIKG